VWCIRSGYLWRILNSINPIISGRGANGKVIPVSAIAPLPKVKLGLLFKFLDDITEERLNSVSKFGDSVFIYGLSFLLSTSILSSTSIFVTIRPCERTDKGY